MGGVIPGVELAIQGFRLAKKQGWIDRLRTLLKEKHRVLVLGSTGTGKTNLLDALHEDLPAAIDALNRTQFARKNRLQIAGEVFEFIDTPGEEGRKTNRIKAIREAMAGGPVGLLNTVCYGYHEYRTGKAQALLSDGKAKEGWLNDHRDIEIDVLREWVPLLASQVTSRWLITVCTKADLWWHEREQVLAYYRSGPYFEALGEAQELGPVLVSHSSVIKRFYGDGLVSPEFDDHLRASLRANLLQVLIEAVSTEGRNVH